MPVDLEHCHDHDCLVADMRAIRHDTARTLKLVEIHNAQHEARAKMLDAIFEVVKIAGIVVGSGIALGGAAWGAIRVFGG